MKATWKGEDGAPDSIVMLGTTFEAGKAVDVSDEMGAALVLNPFFTVAGKSPDKGADPNAPKIPGPKPGEG